METKSAPPVYCTKKGETIKLRIVLILAVAIILSACSVSDSTPLAQQTEQPVVRVVEDTTITNNEQETTPTKEFTILGSSFDLSPAEIKVKLGDRVRINYISDDIGHNLVIDEFNVRSSVISGGASEVVEFIADRVGTFDIYCSVGQHKALGMEGKLIVEP